MMKFEQRSFAHLSDDDLLTTTSRLAACERHATAELIAVLTEVDRRQLHLGQGCSSLFTYCTEVLHLSEHAAYHRITAARAARRFPDIIGRLADGSLTVTAVGLLSPHLTDENHLCLLDGACHRSKREIEEMIVALKPKPPVVSLVRKLPVTIPRPIGSASLPRAPEVVVNQVAVGPPPVSVPRSAPPTAPLSPDRYKVQFTVSRATYDKLRRVQDLLRHAVKDGDPAVVFDRALTLLLADLEKKKCACAKETRTQKPVTPGSRHVPAVVRREVWARDGGRCAFVGAQGRCVETGFLEFHHVQPYAAGGPATTENIELRCSAHNKYEAEQFFSSNSFFVRETGPSWDSDSSRRSGSILTLDGASAGGLCRRRGAMRPARSVSSKTAPQAYRSASALIRHRRAEHHDAPSDGSPAHELPRPTRPQ